MSSEDKGAGVRVSWTSELTHRLLLFIKKESLYRQIYFPRSSTLPKTRHLRARLCLMDFFKDNEWMKDAERRGLATWVEREEDWRPTAKWGSKIGNPIDIRIKLLKERISSGYYKKQYKISDQWVSFEDIPNKSDRKSFQKKHPYYFLLKELCQREKKNSRPEGFVKVDLPSADPATRTGSRRKKSPPTSPCSSGDESDSDDGSESDPEIPLAGSQAKSSSKKIKIDQAPTTLTGVPQESATQGPLAPSSAQTPRIKEESKPKNAIPPSRLANDIQHQKVSQGYRLYDSSSDEDPDSGISVLSVKPQIKNVKREQSATPTATVKQESNRQHSILQTPRQAPRSAEEIFALQSSHVKAEYPTPVIEISESDSEPEEASDGDVASDISSSVVVLSSPPPGIWSKPDVPNIGPHDDKLESLNTKLEEDAEFDDERESRLDDQVDRHIEVSEAQRSVAKITASMEILDQRLLEETSTEELLAHLYDPSRENRTSIPLNTLSGEIFLIPNHMLVGPSCRNLVEILERLGARIDYEPYRKEQSARKPRHQLIGRLFEDQERPLPISGIPKTTILELIERLLNLFGIGVNRNRREATRKQLKRLSKICSKSPLPSGVGKAVFPSRTFTTLARHRIAEIAKAEGFKHCDSEIEVRSLPQSVKVIRLSLTGDDQFKDNLAVDRTLKITNMTVGAFSNYVHRRRAQIEADISRKAKERSKA